MNLDIKKTIVRQFYEEHHENLFEKVCNRRYEDFIPLLERITSVEIGEIAGGIPFEVEIKRINQNIPQAVSDAFARHLWYSQWNLASIYLAKFPIDGQNFFFLFHVGICDDAWDNDTRLLEIFTEQGEFLSATDSIYKEAADIKWNNKPFPREAFMDGKRGDPPPPWSRDDPNAVYYNEPLWTEEMLRREGAEIEEKDMSIRYILRW